MRYALIDNSTLTSVQRLLGDIAIKNKAITDMDILAYESYLEAILFFDEIICIDDYKKGYEESRKKYFPNIKFINKSLFDYDGYVSQALQIADSIVPKIESGKITEKVFSDFFKLLRMNMVFTWDMSESVYYLTQKMLQLEGGLDLDKYSKLSAAIYEDLIVRKRTETRFVKDKYILRDVSGEINPEKHTIIDKSGSKVEAQVSKQLLVFLSGLNWLAQRTIFYTLLGDYLHADVILHPIRQSFNVNILSKLYSIPDAKLKPLIDAMNNKANEAINQIKGLTEPYVISEQIPLFSIWLVNKTKDPLKVIDEAFELRDNDLFFQARTKLRELCLLIESGKNKEYIFEGNKLVAEIGVLMNKITTKYGVGTEQGVPVSKFISFWNTAATFLPKLPKLPDIDYKIKSLEFLKHVIPVSGFKGIYRSLIEDLSAIERLGKYHELLSSKIVLEQDASFYSPKVEEFKYLKAKSSFKIPME
jgi:hypothetical protein